MKKGFVFVVGAGCGEADLITVRGLRCLQRCDSLIYDDLIDKALLEEAPSKAEKLYVGKRSGQHSYPQEEINRLLIQKACDGQTVVRLKGGDPYVFGRGGEEILALQKAGIPFEEVPGISSAIAVPAFAGIPVTHRGVSQSVHIITGYSALACDGLAAGIEQLAALSGTLVFLMGVKHARLIAEQLIQAGKSKKTPAAVISARESYHPVTLRTTLENLGDLIEKMDFPTPAVIVIGATAEMKLLD